MIQIRPSTPADLPVLMDLYDSGRRIMRGSGNMNQWTKGYPSEEIVMQDITRGNSYLCLDEAEHPVGTLWVLTLRMPASMTGNGWTTRSPTAPSIAWQAAKMPVAYPRPVWNGVMRKSPTCGQTPTATTASCNTSC